jgi:predicted 3-demethylubiquinone-9 3-methyltransferase (glyoxalase superfamily)
MDRIARVVPCLWFDRQAEEAATFYVSVFKNGLERSTDEEEASCPNGKR